MMIWMPTALGDMGVEHGVLRAADAQQALSFEDTRSQLSRMAEEALEQARQQAEQIVAQANAQADALIEQAHASIDEARNQGYAEGEARALNEWHERQARQTLKRSTEVRGMNVKLAEVVTSAVERIVHTEGRTALYQRALKSVQTLSRQATAMTLRVGLGDIDAAQDSIASIAYLQEAGLTLEVVVDSSLPPGSCVFESDVGVVDASLHTQLNALKAAMERAVRRAIVETPPEQILGQDDDAQDEQGQQEEQARHYAQAQYDEQAQDDKQAQESEFGYEDGHEADEEADADRDAEIDADHYAEVDTADAETDREASS